VHGARLGIPLATLQGWSVRAAGAPTGSAPPRLAHTGWGCVSNPAPIRAIKPCPITISRPLSGLKVMRYALALNLVGAIPTRLRMYGLCPLGPVSSWQNLVARAGHCSPCVSMGSALPAWSWPGRAIAGCMAHTLESRWLPSKVGPFELPAPLRALPHLVWLIPDGVALATPKLPSEQSSHVSSRLADRYRG
jgi:hypothetical protein